MKKKSVLFIVFVCVLLFSIGAYAETDSIYAHISYVDNEAFVTRCGEDNPVKAVVNLPLLAGDTIFTKDEGRCEVQFGNGTIIRLDKKTQLKIDTILTKGLITEKKITTLKLDHGHIYSMNQVYKGEIFQVITGTAAIKMIKRSTNSILVNKKEGTHVYVDRGKVGVLSGKDNKSRKKVFVKGGKGLWITPGSELKDDNSKKNTEFYLWNRNVNKNFKELHYGTSKVPDVIYRRSPGIVHFAERFSSKYGTWEYSDIFGYVWKPADEIFKDRRPFFDANFVKINGELVLVPNQPWGWAPAHLGTWFWSKTQGWIWIPGDVLSKGICAVGLKKLEDLGIQDLLYRVPTGLYLNVLNYWIDWIYGDTDLYKVYRIRGSAAWAKAYEKKYNKKPNSHKLALKLAPDQVKSGLEKIGKTAFEKIAPELNRAEQNTSDLTSGKVKILREITPGKAKTGKKTLIKASRDWNPDACWARKTGVKIFYSAKKDSILCPELKLSSKEITGKLRVLLRRSAGNRTLSKNVVRKTSTGGTNSNNNMNGSRASGTNTKTSRKTAGSRNSASKAQKK